MMPELGYMFPRYRIPPGVLAALILSWIGLRPRNFRADALACISSLSPALRVSGCEYIPAAGPCLVTFNHYHRPGFNVWWLAMALAAALPVGPLAHAHVIMTNELTYPGKWFGPLGRPVSRFVLKRLARIYGFSSMPPMPPRENDLTERASAVRAVLSWLDQTPEPVLLMAPEGGDQPGGCLVRPPAGVGRFIGLMAARGLSILPAAGWEQAGALCLRFGPAYHLSLPKELAHDEIDRVASTVVMRAIGALLPEPLRGDFS